MTRCERFEDEGVLQLERGVPLDGHFDTCPDCRDARRVHAQLIQEIADLDRAVEPPASWQSQVWSRLEQERDSHSFWRSHAGAPSGRRWISWLAPAGAIVATAVLGVWLLGRSPATLSLNAEIIAGQSVRRGTDAHPGDLLRVRGRWPTTHMVN